MSGRLEERIFHRIRVRLTAARKDRGWSQEKLAARSGIDRVAIGYIEQGRRNPTLPTLYRLCRALDLPLEKLLKNL